MHRITSIGRESIEAVSHRDDTDWVGLTPKIPWDQKLVDCCLGSLCEET
jgi:hypothetical protein